MIRTIYPTVNAEDWASLIRLSQYHDMVIKEWIHNFYKRGGWIGLNEQRLIGNMGPSRNPATQTRVLKNLQISRDKITSFFVLRDNLSSIDHKSFECAEYSDGLHFDVNYSRLMYIELSSCLTCDLFFQYYFCNDDVCLKSKAKLKSIQSTKSLLLMTFLNYVTEVFGNNFVCFFAYYFITELMILYFVGVSYEFCQAMFKVMTIVAHDKIEIRKSSIFVAGALFLCFQIIPNFNVIMALLFYVSDKLVDIWFYNLWNTLPIYVFLYSLPALYFPPNSLTSLGIILYLFLDESKILMGRYLLNQTMIYFKQYFKKKFHVGSLESFGISNEKSLFFDNVQFMNENELKLLGQSSVIIEGLNRMINDLSNDILELIREQRMEYSALINERNLKIFKLQYLVDSMHKGILFEYLSRREALNSLLKFPIKVQSEEYQMEAEQLNKKIKVLLSLINNLKVEYLRKEEKQKIQLVREILYINMEMFPTLIDRYTFAAFRANHLHSLIENIINTHQSNVDVTIDQKNKLTIEISRKNNSIKSLKNTINDENHKLVRIWNKILNTPGLKVLLEKLEKNGLEKVIQDYKDSLSISSNKINSNSLDCNDKPTKSSSENSIVKFIINSPITEQKKQQVFKNVQLINSNDLNKKLIKKREKKNKKVLLNDLLMFTTDNKVDSLESTSLKDESVRENENKSTASSFEPMITSATTTLNTNTAATTTETTSTTTTMNWDKNFVNFTDFKVFRDTSCYLLNGPSLFPSSMFNPGNKVISSVKYKNNSVIGSNHDNLDIESDYIDGAFWIPNLDQE
ncbi:hypothetical protein ROZALSC1DRAFT_29400 [Rozella allomycis CSF55]|uniref:Uncharacterized protein n=1 Tax=Rozella allomycis (strain CSF55) TaxID=988480 RepID=A0A075AYQ0_ROZAC|nr:hypothetical protein O9G_000645 [Rozella allomycis CSF55]RKP18942.1 hypothetical protein ROZALSC1DRAFT_29400 [Rozella allomycis CSF55]|eukprot:EPZ35249.1 hypothetical protein O9G_000645 [Rozella allomycis CSF55]